MNGTLNATTGQVINGTVVPRPTNVFGTWRVTGACQRELTGSAGHISWLLHCCTAVQCSEYAAVVVCCCKWWQSAGRLTALHARFEFLTNAASNALLAGCMSERFKHRFFKQCTSQPGHC
jgi:hypothetical protein